MNLSGKSYSAGYKKLEDEYDAQIINAHEREKIEEKDEKYTHEEVGELLGLK